MNTNFSHPFSIKDIYGYHDYITPLLRIKHFYPLLIVIPVQSLASKMEYLGLAPIMPINNA